tara:strand:+ start:2942 stop:4192 length:1251 start_codon:yes stop_codon:yes gene_type:complete
MTQSNHITGGTVFTGIFASLWDINIFSDINLLMLCWFASLLPDIDHTKSPIGKLFYPIAKYLDKKFGHRTITHSLIFVFSTWLIVKSILPPPFPLIFLLGISSHLLFDMMTVQGVPLLYPFRKNPCVLPGNPEARIRSGNTRAELTAFVLFIVCGTFCYPLMANGFWMTFNKTLGSKKQLISEFKRSDKILLVEYEFRRNFEHYSGVGYCLSAKESEIVFLDTASRKFVHLISEDVPKGFTPHFSEYSSLSEISTEIEVSEFSVSKFDSLVHSNPVLSANIFSNQLIAASLDSKNQTGQHFTGEYLNTIILSEPHQDNQAIKIKTIQLNQLIENFRQDQKSFREDLLREKELKAEYQIASDYRKSEINKELAQLHPQAPDEREYQNKLEILREEIKYLSQANQQIKIFGTIKLITL